MPSTPKQKVWVETAVSVKPSRRLTAAQARELAGPTVAERVDEALVEIEAAARAKKRVCNLHGWWAHGGYDESKSPEYREAKRMLQDLGYTVSFFYEDGSFAVNMYTVVTW